MYCGIPQHDPDKLVALILAGGQSSRMGSDKGLLNLHGKTWVQHVADLCAELKLEVYYSINALQVEQYAAYLPNDRISIDSLDLKGPLAGLLSFYVQHPDQDVLLLPCDMIGMKKTVLQELMDSYETIHIGHDITVFQHSDGSVEPFPGIYSSEALKKIYWLFVSGNLMKHSLKYVIEISNSYLLPVSPSLADSFLNANSPEDINRF